MIIREEHIEKIIALLKAREELCEFPASRDMVGKQNEDFILISMVDEIRHADLVALELDTLISGLFFSTLVPNFDLKPGFDTPRDHYPDILIHDAVEQFCLASSHRMYNLPTEEFRPFLSSLTIRKHSFLELDAPVFIFGADSGLQQLESLYRRSTEFILVQENRIAVEGRAEIEVPTLDYFRRLRNASRQNLIDAGSKLCQVPPISSHLVDTERNQSKEAV
jgi:hypothetical protein